MRLFCSILALICFFAAVACYAYGLLLFIDGIAGGGLLYLLCSAILVVAMVFFYREAEERTY